MPKISIREQTNQPHTNGFAVSVRIDDAEEFDTLTVSDPLVPQNRERLEWHFEQFVNYPYLNKVQPQEAAAIIREAGENLFKQLFDERDIYFRYKEAIKDGFDDLVIEISGSSEFHSIHWEALKDPDFPAFALTSPILRKDLKPQNYPADVRETATINLLIVTARPAGRNDVGYRTISRPLVELLRNAQLPVKVHILRPATYESLDKHLDSVGKGFYHVVHFDVHGALLTFEDFEKIENEKPANHLTYQMSRYGRTEIEPYTGKDAFLFLDLYRETDNANDDGFRADPVRADELANLLLAHGVPLIILNACQSAKELGEQEPAGALPIAEETSLASRLMRAGAQMILAMSYSVTVTAAEILMKNLYREIFRGKTVHQAIKAGRGELHNRKLRRAVFNYEIPLEDWLLPVVYQKRNVELKTKTLSGQEEEALLNERAEVDNMPEVEYGFHGRDIDILNIERRVLLKNNLLLIRGMGGAGKTTLLKHLAWWWRATGFAGKIFYFGYDEKAYTRQEIMFKIAQTLYDKFEFANFQAMSETAQQQKLTLRLRTERHLLILDNLESIQGNYLAIKNTLAVDEQTKLKDFLAELRGAMDDVFQPQTIVLLGSRSAEAWLAKGTFNENLYDLGGLDRESATQFAEEILRRNGVAKYKTDDNFKKLLKLLAGFPLPLKVICDNLKRQPPAGILAALRAGDVDFTTGTAEEKTADILKCIEYSHSNIAPEKQALLLCLAPFTATVVRIYFEDYIAELKKHAALAELRHELWDEVFAEAVERGLMSRLEGSPVYQLQPILPVFLKLETKTAERADFKSAVQTAFRDYFNGVSGSIRQLMDSKEAQEKTLGRGLANLEFENIETCLDYSLAGQTSILNAYSALSGYYDAVQNNQAGLELGKKVLEKLETYPRKISEGAMGLEFVGVLDDLAKRQLLLKDYVAAKSSYLKALEIWLANQSFESEVKRSRSATIYHQLGYIAQEQREWRKAKDFYQQARAIYIEFNDRYQQAATLHNLGVVAQEQEKFAEAQSYLLQVFEIFAEFGDKHNLAITLSSLLKLWKASGDDGLLATVGETLGISAAEVRELFERKPDESPDEAGNPE